MKRESDIGKHVSAPGIPSTVTLEAAQRWVETRVSKKRLDHIRGVVTVGREIAVGLELDPFPVELACWLHDACKEMKGKELIEFAQTNGMNVAPDELENGPILHGPVAAVIARKELRITNQDVLDAIAEHTLGAINMSVTSKIVYLADKLEASRPEEFTEPIWRALRAIPTKGPPNECHDFTHTTEEDLDQAMVVSLTLVAKNLLKKGKPIQPRAMVVRNHFLKLIKPS